MPKSRSDGGSAEMSAPACSIVPEVWMSSPAMARSNVVLPQPDGPRKQTNSPSSMSSESPVERGEVAEALGQVAIRR